MKYLLIAALLVPLFAHADCGNDNYCHQRESSSHSVQQNGGDPT